MSSLKMTFSLASLVILMAFIAMPVMAHETGNRPESTPESHTAHPVTVRVENDETTTAVNETVPIHGAHPVPKITLKAQAGVVQGDQIKLTAAANTFTVVVTFDAPVNVVEVGTAGVVDATVLADGQLSIRVISDSGKGATTASALGSNPDQVDLGTVIRTGTAGTTFELPLTVGANSIPDGLGADGTTADATLNNLTFNIRVNVNAAYGLQRDIGVTTVDGGSSVARLKEFMLVKEFTSDDPTAVMFEISGTPSLEGPFTVTFTSVSKDTDGDLIGAKLEESDIEVSAGDGFVVARTLNDASPSDEPMTVWKVIVQPVAGAAKISVTIKDDETTPAAAAEENFRIIISDSTLVSITAAEGADDTAPFVITLTFTGTAVLTEDDLMVTPVGGDDPATTDVVEKAEAAEIGDIAAVLGSDGEVWQVEITPVAGMETTVALADDSDLVGSVTLTVKTKAAQAAGTSTPTPGDISGTRTEIIDGYEVALSGVVAPNDFAIVAAASLPNLELFFSRGGTITLTDADATKTDHAAKTIVISEILWGLDLGAAVGTQDAYQFIELYNTNKPPAADATDQTAGQIDLTGWKLVFKEGRPVPDNDVDQVSNVAGAGWIVDIGQSGKIAGSILVGGTSSAVNLVSMYRNINYAKVQGTEADAERVKGVPGGNGKGSWKASQRASATTNGVTASNGDKHFVSVSVIGATSVPRSPFIINEIGNDTNGGNDWVELQNVTDDVASLNNYQLSVVESGNKDTRLFHFGGNDYKVPAKGYIVVSSRHPRDTDLAEGKDVSVADDEEENRGASHLFVVRSFNLPDSGKNLLILRNNHDANKLKTANNIIDVVGTLKTEDRNLGTSLWPLKATGGPHGNVIDGTDDEDFRAGKVYRRANAGGGTGEKHIAVVGYTGIGYDRAADNSGVNGGTPGYDNGARKGKVAELSAAEVTISEIMIDTGEGQQNLPQWIELYNSSMTQAVNTNGWKLAIENGSDVETAFSATLTLGVMTISPNQTVLIATTTGRQSDSDHFPSTRVVNLWTTKAHRDALEMIRRTDQAFSTTGFHFKLTDADNKLVDEAGNLDGNRRTQDAPAWALPKSLEDGRRSSLIRVYDDGVAVNGTLAAGWVSADATNLAFAISQTYFGDPDDFGTPGFRGGGPLPVSLSKFRPELLDSGEIVVRWITESELNNAGFNILRSETRNGEFTKLNTKLIAGQGTTSERTVYSFPDTSAKPNVAYYYQIQDVSLDGKVQTLRQSRIKGYVSPSGKLTTTWGELKALQ